MKVFRDEYLKSGKKILKVLADYTKDKPREEYLLNKYFKGTWYNLGKLHTFKNQDWVKNLIQLISDLYEIKSLL